MRAVRSPGTLLAAFVLAALSVVAAPSAGAISLRGGPAVAAEGAVVGPIHDISIGCPGTGDTAAAVDHAAKVVYQAFEGCDHDDGIGFVRSLDDAGSYSTPVVLPASHGGWDPWMAVGSDGTLFVAFMNTIKGATFPVIDVSTDHGASFTTEESLRPLRGHNWGDAEYLATAPNGALYVAWSYGPSNAEVHLHCSPTGSCWATTGDLNEVVQCSTDDARSFSPLTVVSADYPDGGADEGDITVAPDGNVDVLYQAYATTGTHGTLADGHEFYTTSSDGGRTWSAPVQVGATVGSITIDEWWNDGSVAVDPDGTVIATWDTQLGTGPAATDIGWVSLSTDGGATWSTPLRATPDTDSDPHIMEVAPGPRGRFAVAWLSDSDPRGYALYLRMLARSTNGGAGQWVTSTSTVSRLFGNPDVSPGDTFGIAPLTATSLVLSWGSAAPPSTEQASVYATVVRP